LEDLGDSVDEASKAEIKQAAEDLRGTLESEDAAEITAKTDALRSAFHKVSEQMYAAASQQAQSDGAAGNGATTADADGTAEEEVVDAEVVEGEEGRR
nr:molecular chaperone DnaK [Thermoleophilaceae bacterium]